MPGCAEDSAFKSPSQGVFHQKCVESTFHLSILFFVVVFILFFFFLNGQSSDMLALQNFPTAKERQCLKFQA